MINIPGQGGIKRVSVPSGLVPAMKFGRLTSNLSAQVTTAIGRVNAQHVNHASFLDQVPRAFRSNVESLATKAWERKWKNEGVFADKFDLTENMAFQWLVKQETFSIIAEENGFSLISPSPKLDKKFQGIILALSVNGSLIGITPPLEGEASPDSRLIYYGRINLREERPNLLPVFTGELLTSLEINESMRAAGIKTPGLQTSPIIAMAFKTTETGKEKLEEAKDKTYASMSQMSMQFDAIDNVWLPKEKKK